MGVEKPPRGTGQAGNRTENKTGAPAASPSDKPDLQLIDKKSEVLFLLTGLLEAGILKRFGSEGDFVQPILSISQNASMICDLSLLACVPLVLSLFSREAKQKIRAGLAPVRLLLVAVCVMMAITALRQLCWQLPHHIWWAYLFLAVKLFLLYSFWRKNWNVLAK